MDWRVELEEAGERAVREARVSVYRASSRLERERAEAYLAGVLWVVTRLRGRPVLEREGPVVFVRWFADDLARQSSGKQGAPDLPGDLRPPWHRGKSHALRSINAAKLSLLP